MKLQPKPNKKRKNKQTKKKETKKKETKKKETKKKDGSMGGESFLLTDQKSADQTHRSKQV